MRCFLLSALIALVVVGIILLTNGVHLLSSFDRSASHALGKVPHSLQALGESRRQREHPDRQWSSSSSASLRQGGSNSECSVQSLSSAKQNALRALKRIDYSEERGRNNTDQEAEESIFARGRSHQLDRIAWAIPVTGLQDRALHVCRILSALLLQGVRPDSIFVCFDNGRRGRGAIPTDDLFTTRRMANAAGVRWLETGVLRDRREKPRTEFGLFLARHYKRIFDYLLTGASDLKDLRVTKAGSLSLMHYDFVALIEDDLRLSPGLASYFAMCAAAMDADTSIGSASAWHSIGYPANTESIGPRVELGEPFNFPLRRTTPGYVSPGFMLSRFGYLNYFSKPWLDEMGNFQHKTRQKIHQWNDANWDTYLNLMMGHLKLDTIYPDTSLVRHLGGTGYTVREDRQQMIYGRMALSQTDFAPFRQQVTWSSLESNLIYHSSRYGYLKALTDFVADPSTLILSCQDNEWWKKLSTKIRDSRVLLLATSWKPVLFDVLGLSGGHLPGVSLPPPMYKGTYVFRWATNTVLLAETSSTVLAQIRGKLPELSRCAEQEPLLSGDEHLTNARVRSLGCFTDTGSKRDLDFEPRTNAGKPVGVWNPRSCVQSCFEAGGFKYGAMQYGVECRCGDSYGDFGQSTHCDKPCHDNPAFKCGGSFANSVYEFDFHEDGQSTGQSLVKLAGNGLVFGLDGSEAIVVGRFLESCDDVCASHGRDSASSSGVWKCDNQLLGASMASTDCSTWKKLLGCKFCVHPRLPKWNDERGQWLPKPFVWHTVAPGRISESDFCIVTRESKFASCSAVVPESERGALTFRRACVCKRVA